MKRSKKYKEVLKLIDKTKSYNLEEAINLLPKLSISKFDSSVEIHINLNLSEKQKKTVIKGSTTLPHQVGSSVVIAVITTPDHIDKAKEADVSGGEDLIKKIQGGWDDFDILIATPDIMVKLAALGKVLGPKGKMPNPKNGTITTDIEKTIKSYKKGKLNFRSDEQGGIHQVVGKCNMKTKKLTENILTFFKAILQETKNLQAVPFKSVFLSPTMGPSIRLDVNNLLKDLT
jgi:large subunit ribosomal protein L1